jgi:hypothetical protein
MASTSLLSPGDRLKRRPDLVVRSLPEISMCMVYRPRPARVITLNPRSWMLLELCNGSTRREIEEAYLLTLHANGRAARPHDVNIGLQALIDHRLIEICRNENERAEALEE